MRSLIETSLVEVAVNVAGKMSKSLTVADEAYLFKRMYVAP